jgi:hypothetical protein
MPFFAIGLECLEPRSWTTFENGVAVVDQRTSSLTDEKQEALSQPAAPATSCVIGDVS